MFEALLYIAQRPGYKKIVAKVFGELWNVVLEENEEGIKVSESNQWTSSWTYRTEEDISKYKILRIKANWITHILRRNCFLHDAIEGRMMKMKGMGRRRTQLLDDLRNGERYWELKEEAEDRKKMEMTVYRSNISIFYKSLDLLISSKLNNNLTWLNKENRSC